MSLIVIGNPENRRVRFFQDALRSLGKEPATVVSYEEIISSCERLYNFPGELPLRIDSPGENFAVEKLLLKAGESRAEEEGAPCISATTVNQLQFDKGRILYPRQWYLGYREVLASIDKWARTKQHTWMNAPADIAEMFSKSASQQRLRDHSIPVPPPFPTVENYEHLLALMKARDVRRVFIKLQHGSSASGVVALQVYAGHQQALTTAELVTSGGDVRLYNSLKLRVYTRPSEIATVINELCRHGVHVEQWIRKARIGNQIFDLRVVVIADEPEHAVVRLSRSALTNLHLGNQRGQLPDTIEMLGDQWEQILITCRSAMKAYPDSLYAGIDVGVAADLQRHFVIEMNAFGDLLPGVIHNERDTYTAEVAAFSVPRDVNPGPNQT